MKTATIAAGVACTLIGLGMNSSCLAQESRAEYTIREDEAQVGSHIRRNRIEMREVALNLPYEKLSERDRANLHSWWESIPDGDEPPFPLKGLKPVFDGMLKAQNEFMVEGQLTLIATIDTKGEVEQVKAIGSPSPQMTLFAASLVGMTKFKPAICSGKPCKMDFPFSFDFKVGF